MTLISFAEILSQMETDRGDGGHRKGMADGDRSRVLVAMSLLVLHETRHRASSAAEEGGVLVEVLNKLILIEMGSGEWVIIPADLRGHNL